MLTKAEIINYVTSAEVHNVYQSVSCLSDTKLGE